MAIVYFVVLLAGSALAMPLGGIFNALLGLTFAIPYVGHVFAVLFNRLIRLTLLGKVAAWTISASGLIASYVGLVRVVGPPQGVYQWSAVAAAAGIVALDVAWRVVMFQTFHVTTVEDVKDYMPAFLRAKFHTLTVEEKAVLIRQNFADMNFTAILQFLVAFGVLLFALAHAGVIHTKTATLPSLDECLVVSFSFVSLAGGDTVTFVGLPWFALRFVAGVVLLVWAVAFVGFAIELLPKASDTQVDPLGQYRAELERIVAEVSAQYPPQAESTDLGSGNTDATAVLPGDDTKTGHQA